MKEEKCKTCIHWEEKLTPINFGLCKSIDFNAMVLVSDKSFNSSNEFITYGNFKCFNYFPKD